MIVPSPSVISITFISKIFMPRFSTSLSIIAMLISGFKILPNASPPRELVLVARIRDLNQDHGFMPA